MIKAYFLPTSLPEALDLLAEHHPMVTAGGTVARLLLNEGVFFPETVMSLKKTGLDQVRVNGSVQIGAMATMTRMTQLKEIPMLQAAARQVAAWAVRNMGTVGGNIFASFVQPHGDFAVALLALDAELQFASKSGKRAVALRDFYVGGRPNPAELLTGIQVKVPAGKTAYMKYARRALNAPSIVAVAAHVQEEGRVVKSAAIALNAVDRVPIRAVNAENMLVGKLLNAESIAAAAEAASAECHPSDDEVASAWYRRQMVNVFVRRTLEQL